MAEEAPPTGGRDALVLTGPTATGKSELALAVARELDGEIISMDSRQVYRGMDIGTAKVGADARNAVPHHGLDLIDPDERFSAARFAELARGWIAGIRGRGRTPLLVGGTGFFLRALMEPLFREPSLPADRRAALERYLDTLPLEELRRWVRALDPRWLEEIGTADRQRTRRALEIALLSGRPLSVWWREAAGAPGIRPLVFVLELPRDMLYRRIDARARAMIDAGLVREVEALLEAGYDRRAPGLTATGYGEIVAVLEGECSLEAAVDRIQRATRRYARRQLTWFRNQMPADTVRLDATRPQGALTEEIVERWAESGS